MLINAADNRRDLAIVLTELVCGLRPSELVQLEANDVDLKARCLHIRDHGRGIKNFMERKAVMNDETVKGNQRVARSPAASYRIKNLFLN